MNFEELLNSINSQGNTQDKNFINYKDSNLDIYLESLYDSILSSIINKAKKDPGNYDELDILKKFKRDISNETRKQYKVIISYCKDSELPNLKEALKKYNILHFLKFVIRIIEVDDNYNEKVSECKKYFTPENIDIFQYLYKHDEVSEAELKRYYDTKTSLPSKSSNVYDLVIASMADGNTTYTLSPKGKNLYAFFMMKEIDIKGLDTDYNESKVNEVLEYLIQYVSTQSVIRRKQIKRPLLYSACADSNLQRLTYMLDYKNSYSQDFIILSSDQESESYKWMGDKPWKTY